MNKTPQIDKTQLVQTPASIHRKFARALDRFERELTEFDRQSIHPKMSRTHRTRVRLEIALSQFRETLRNDFHDTNPELKENENPYSPFPSV